VLNVGSLSGFAPLPAMAVYAASKAAILSFTEALHTEVRPSGVAVTALCPGFVRTEFVDVAGLTAAAARTPPWVFQDAGDIAAAGLRALERNRRVVVPSVLYRVVAAGLRMAPDGALATAFDAWSPFRRGGAIAEAGAVGSGRA
jgi:short-subunit dehydrogenase